MAGATAADKQVVAVAAAMAAARTRVRAEKSLGMCARCVAGHNRERR